MTFVVTDNCRRCRFTDCVTVCPVDCFHGDDEMLYIDPDECIDCGACEPACPVTAIFAEEDIPEDQMPYLEIDAEWFSDKDAARKKVDDLKPPGEKG